MKRALIHLAIVALAGSMAAAQTNPPAPPPQPKAGATPKAAPAAPKAPVADADDDDSQAAPKAKPKPRAGTYVYHSAPGSASTYVYRTSAAGGSYLGVDVQDVSSDRVSALKLKSDQGVEITMVDQDSPAGKAGLKENDVVVSFNGKAVDSAEQLKRLIRETKPGQSIALGLMRDGQSQTVNVTLGDRSKIFATASRRPIPVERYNRVIRIPEIEIPSIVMVQTSRRSGVSVENLTDQLGEYFGVRNGDGVLVRTVEKGSKAEAAGLKAGDVIIRVDNERVSNTSEWGRLLRRRDSGAVKVNVMRDRREQTLTLTLPEQSSDAGNSFVVTTPDLSELQVELQNLGPALSREQNQVQLRVQHELAAHQKEIQKAMREAQREIERSMREMERERVHERDNED